MSHHCTLAAYCIVQRWREVFFAFCSALLLLLCPILCSAKGQMTQKVQLGKVSLFGLKERRSWEDLATGLKYQWDITEYTELETSQRYTMKRSELWKGKFQLDCEKLFCFVPSTVIKCWNRLLRSFVIVVLGDIQNSAIKGYGPPDLSSK